MRVLGIDLGRTSVKAVELDTAFGRYEIHDYHEIQIDPGQNPAQAAALLISRLSKKPDRLAVSLPPRQATFRNIKVPTRDKKAVQAALTFELEDDLPFELEKATFDYSILSQDRQGTHVHVAVTLKEYVSNFLSMLKSSGLDPDIVSTETWAFRTVFNRILNRMAQEKPVLLLKISHEYTSLYIQWRGFAIVSREIQIGGRDLTDAIIGKYGLTNETAEKTKIDNGFILTQTQQKEAKPDQIDFSNTLRSALEPIFLELRQTDLTCKNITQQHLRAIYLCGGTSLLPGLKNVIEEETNIPVYPLKGLSSLATSGVTYSEHTDAAFVLAAGLGLCLVGQERSQAINLRRGEFTKSGKVHDLSFSALKKPFFAAAAVAACLFASLSVQSGIYQTNIQDMNKRVERSMRSFFGFLSKSAIRTYLSNTSRLKSAVKAQLTTQREIANLLESSTSSPLDFLKTLSDQTSKDLIVDLIEFEAGSGTDSEYDAKATQTAKLTFQVANPQMAEKLFQNIKKILSDVKKEPMKEVKSSEDKESQWSVTFTGKLSQKAKDTKNAN